MNIIWIVADTLRQDHLGSYGHPYIRTPELDALAKRSTRFNRHYLDGFPTMPARANHHTGRFITRFMGWEPLPEQTTTLAQLLTDAGYHTAAVVDTPFYWRNGMNYDRGFQSFFPVQGQKGSYRWRPEETGHREAIDVVSWWRRESDRCAARTMTLAGDWLERHYREEFFLYVDTWDPHEPWDAPDYYTRLYMPEYDGEIVNPSYTRWQEDSDLSAALVEKGHATYCGEITMVDTWIGHLLRKVENMGLSDNTAIIFTSDHGTYFGEHGGMFGKMHQRAPSPEAVGTAWGYSPLYEELVRLPLFISVPGVAPSTYEGLTSAADVMPTVLDTLGVEIPEWADGESLLPRMRNPSLPGRESTISTVPFANPGDRVRSVDDESRELVDWPVTTVTTQTWSLLYSVEPGRSELFNLVDDPRQERNVINRHPEIALDLHQRLIEFMRQGNVSEHLLSPRLKLSI